MSLFVATPQGNWLSTDVDDLSNVSRLRACLVAAGYDVGETDELTVSDHAIVAPLLTALEVGAIPQIPVPLNAGSVPPDVSESIRIAVAPLEEPFIKVAGTWKSIPVLKKNGWKLEPEFPTADLAYDRFWSNMGSFIIRGPQKWQRSVTTKEGMTESTAFTLGLELGLGKSLENIAKKLTATFQKSFSVTKETTITETYALDVPAGQIAVFTLWQLVNEVVILDSSGNEYAWTGWAIPPLGPTSNVKYKVRWEVSRARQATPSYAFDPHFFTV
jgi:hypothetical protein